MKKFSLILLMLLLSTAVLNSSQAFAARRIKSSGISGGSVPTQETSRTHQATGEAFHAIFGVNCVFQEYQDDLVGIYISSECCSSMIPVSSGQIVRQVCPNGNYSNIYYSLNCGPSFICDEIKSGTWNVECDPTLIQLSSLNTKARIRPSGYSVDN